ncbi:Membrane protein OS=Streptomyces microflavus OX=1919 GN=Smic_29150 PE=4 SV=1 [Streptomyces microflavus]
MTGAGGTTAARHVIGAGDIPVDTPCPTREAAESELSKPMYHENDPNFLQRGLNHVWDWVAGVFDAAAGAAPGGPAGLVVLVLVVIGLAVALWWRPGTPQRSSRPADALFENDGPRSAAQHRAAADTAALRWTEAVQERMRAIVRSLEERALLDPRPGRTADEAAAEAGRALPDHATRPRSAARDFDDVTYGGRTAAYLALRALDTELDEAKPVLPGSSRGATG